MKKITSLPPAILRPACDPNQFPFTTTAEITNFIEYIGQSRALDALGFGIEMRLKSYHLYACGPSGLGKSYFIRHYLQHIANKEPSPSDWCYVNNFQEPLKPIALEFSSGEGMIFKQSMKSFIEQLLYAIPALFESKEYRTRIEKIENKYKNKEEKLMNKIEKEAKKNALTILRKENNYDIIPLVDNEKITKDQLEKLSEKEKRELKIKKNKIKNRLEKIKEELPQWYKEKHQKLKNVKNELCTALVSSLISELKEKYTDPKVLSYLRSVQEDIIETPELFIKVKESSNGNGKNIIEKSELIRYEVNVIVSNDKEKHAPIVFEPHPNYTNLVGQLEGVVQYGGSANDFTLIKPGSLHRSNGGYLMVEISKLHKNSQTWDSLKRILLAQKITIEPLQSHGMGGSTQLQPESIPLYNKVILLGDRDMYDTLGSEDDFNKLFQVFVDFETTIDRSDDQIQQFAFYIARIIKRRKLGSFHREAVASIIDQCIRLAGDTRKIALQRSAIVELIEESRYWANKQSREVVNKDDVEKAIEAKIKRRDKIREEYYEDIVSDFILIDTKGEAIGQINGLSTISLSNFTFGIPTRITATTRAGKDAMIDIHREVELGGSNYSKGVLILSGFLKGRYAKDVPFYLTASLVLEQTYGSIDGDSASLAEICALISSLSNVPIKQSFAITGSINQLGLVQGVGGLNEKIEGFFDICSLQGLTGEQGVIIPEMNAKNLMLKQDVVQACNNGLFQVYPVKTVDDALILLMGKDPSVIHDQCEETLKRYAASSRKISRD